MSSKKIGILTFHRALNYGATLQAYALQNFLFDLDIDNEIVDYKCQYMMDHYQKTIRKTNGNKIKGILWSLMTASNVKKERITTTSFVKKYLKTSQPYDSSTINSACDKYSKFISGSDQVWSPTCVGFDSVYFLTFAKSEQKYSYAASIATSKIPDSLNAEFKNRLSDFQGYSVREASAAKIVKQLTGNDAHINIDPSLLITADGWDKIASARKIPQKYIFVFTVLKPKALIDYALKLSEKTGLDIIYLNNQQPKKHKSIKYIDPVTSDEFVSLIKNAEYVCTNSFHGTAFSLIYHKNFVVETENFHGRNIRSEELMNKLGLPQRILSSDSAADINVSSDWDKVDTILKDERELAKSYLTSIVK